MSIKSEIDRITLNISASFSALEESGVEVTCEKTSDNLAAAISEVINSLNATINKINGSE